MKVWWISRQSCWPPRRDVVIVAVGFNPETESEGGKRPEFRLPLGQEQLIQEGRRQPTRMWWW